MIGKDRRSQTLDSVSKADYLQFFKEIFGYHDEDFPHRIIDRLTLTPQVPGQKILQTYDTTRWSIAELTMYEFTGDQEYLQRGSELVRAVVAGYLHTPMDVWDYFFLETREGAEKCRKAYEQVPEEARWHGYAWWHVGGAAEPLGLSQVCHVLNRTDGWESPQLKQDAETALARLVDYHVLDEFQVDRRFSYAWCRGTIHNIAMMMAEGFYRAALLMPEHPHAEQWRRWATETFEKSFNQLSPEDASNYESVWFHSILTMIDILGEGQEAYRLPYHRAYFEHLKEMVTSSGCVVGYGDSGEQGNAAFLPVLEKGATVFRDGAYKYAAHQHFRAIRALPMEQRFRYVEALRWFDAYRWADDSVLPEPPRAGSVITHKAKVVLRTGSAPEQTYLALSSQDGGGHGHFDANAIAHFSRGGSVLLRDGHYHWAQAFFHNRLLWRQGKAPAALLDYLRPRECPWHPTPDGKRIIYASEGPAEGVENDWRPAAEESVTVKFLAGFPEFKAVRTILGPQQRTVVMTAEGCCLVFDYLQVAATTTAACLYYVPEIAEHGEWWVRGKGVPEDSDCDLLIAALEPRQLRAESQDRRDTVEQVVFSSKAGEFPNGAWFVTALLPQDKQGETIELSEVLRQKTIGDATEGVRAQVVIVGQGDNPVIFVCRAGDQPGPLSYQPAGLDGSPCAWALETDADLLCLEPAPEGLRTTIVNGTFLERDGQRLISLPSRGHMQTKVS